MANVHKDFHGALSYGLQFIVEQYGKDGLREFLYGLADTVYAPLVKDLRRRGLDALRDHWNNIFHLEGGEIDMRMEDGALILEVRRCPAILHMKEQGYTIAPDFCEHTRFTNEAICQAAGYICSVEHDQEKGQCVQRFWSAKS